MEHSQCQVAGWNVVNLYAESVDIQHLRECQRLRLHLLVDSVQMFLAPLHLSVDVLLFQALADRFQNLADYLAAIAARDFERFG